MAELGAGEVLLRRDFTAARLSPLATRMLADDGLRTRLAALRDAGAEGPDLSDGVRAIEAILR
jgi:UDP:flavonoid glycosyltransferase YjiC (YdhE family)